MQIGFFDEEKRLSKIDKLGDKLESINKAFHWEMFRPVIDEAFVDENKRHTGRPPYDRLMMFKIIVLQQLYNLSDDSMEYCLNDRLTFMRFVGLTTSSTIPDAKTIWLFKETLRKAGTDLKLFEMFNKYLEATGYITHKGTIVDATFVEAPRQHNNKAENDSIKKGEVPEDWQKPENAAKLAQKDTDARWAKKNEEVHYGYKDHVAVDEESKLIKDFEVTDAAVHDSNVCTQFIDSKDGSFYADGAYDSAEIASQIPSTMENKICKKGRRNHPLTEQEKEENRIKSKTRCRVEHVFGTMERQLGGIRRRTIGIARAKFNICMKNFVYNLTRYVLLCPKTF